MKLLPILYAGLSLGICGCADSSHNIQPTPTPAPVATQPSVSQLSPASARLGGSGFVLTVTGTGFTSASMVQWNGSNRPTTVGSSTQLTAQISAGDLAASGDAAITVSNPSPGGASGSRVFSVFPNAGEFVYVADEQVAMDGTGGKVWMYRIDPSSGALTSANPSFVAASPGAPLAVAADPFGRFVYVAINGCCYATAPPGFPAIIAMFTVDPTTGVLTPTAPATILAGKSATAVIGAISVDPTGRFVYVTTDDNSSAQNGILEFAITTPSGVLTPIGFVAAGPNINAQTVAIEPSGTFLYVTSLTQGVFMFKIDPTTGALTPTSPSTVVAATQPADTSIDPMGKFAYVVNNVSGVVSTFTIDSSTGVLNSTGAVQAGANPGFITVEPLGRFAYVANINTELVYSIDGSTGILSPLGPAGSGSAGTLTFDQSGKFAYAVTAAGVSMFTINPSSGMLSSVGTAPGPSNGVSVAVVGSAH